MRSRTKGPDISLEMFYWKVIDVLDRCLITEMEDEDDE